MSVAYKARYLQIAKKLELDAMRHYRSGAERADNEDVKQLYNELADWEQEHYHAFERQLGMLKEEYFQANNFVPM